MIRLRIAEEEGLADALSDEALRERYEQSDRRARPRSTSATSPCRPEDRRPGRLGARGQPRPVRRAGRPLRRRLHAGRASAHGTGADPAARWPSRPRTPSRAPPSPSRWRRPAASSSASSGPAPSFEELRPELQQAAEGEVDQEAAALVEEVRQDLDVVVNPQYGDLQDDGQVQPVRRRGRPPPRGLRPQHGGRRRRHREPPAARAARPRRLAGGGVGSAGRRAARCGGDRIGPAGRGHRRGLAVRPRRTTSSAWPDPATTCPPASPWSTAHLSRRGPACSTSSR